MKKIFTFAVVSLFSLSAMATDLFSGSQFVTWGQGLQIAAADFASANAGDKLVVTYTGATDGIELKVMNGSFDRLPGSLSWAGIDGDGTHELFLTPEALTGLKAHGLEIIGNNFTCTKVELLDGKAELPEGYVVWTGYFWADVWSTLELVPTSYNMVDFDDYDAIRFYSEANRTDYVLNFKKGWEESDHFASLGDMEVTNEYAEFELTSANKVAIKNADKWIIQFNKEDGAAFNVTDVVLVQKAPTALNGKKASSKAVKAIENGMLVIRRDGIRYSIMGTPLF